MYKCILYILYVSKCIYVLYVLGAKQNYNIIIDEIKKV